MKSPSAIQFFNVSKSFPGVKALDDISFDISVGEIRGIVGENGAGKSTLLNILHGVHAEYEGSVEINGQVVNFTAAQDALNFGIAKVHQEIDLIEEITVGQNIVLGSEPRRGPFIDFNALHRQANSVLGQLSCKFKSEDNVQDLSAGEMQMITIAKALYHKARIISFDEPTSALSSQEVETLFRIIRELKNNGITILYVSHRLDEVFELCDRITVLRDGQYIGSYGAREIGRKKLIQYMVGRDVSAFAVRHRPRRYSEEVVLEVKDLSVLPKFQDISFVLRKGEILGIAGLVGSKRTDVVRAIFGADRKTSGTIFVKGTAKEIRSPEEALASGIGLLPEHRKLQGYAGNLITADNVALTCLPKFSHFGFINHSSKIENCQYYINQTNLIPADPFYYTEQLSGGNQQKVVLAKWLSTEADILIFDEPTKGVDVGAKQEIYRLLEDLVEEGKSIIMVSSELPEIIGMADRVIVMNAGRIVTELTHTSLSEEAILNYAMEEQR